MNRTKIEYVDFTANPITGKCPHGCSYCYAERMRKRFKWSENLEFRPEVLGKIKRRKKPASIFMGSMFDIFADEVAPFYILQIIDAVERSPQHTFLFLTKNSQRYFEFKFPENCWLGVSDDGIGYFNYTNFEKLGNKIWISFEPLIYDPQDVDLPFLDWIVIGGLTPKSNFEKEWVENLCERAKTRNIPIFLKSNLRPIWDEKLIQEIPF